LIELGILGPLEARRDGASIRLGAAKERALLTALLMRANAIVSRDQLIEDLWGDDPPVTAGHALEVYVSKLRRALGRELVQTQGPGYVLAVQPDAVDAIRFERLVHEGRASLETNAAEAAETLRTALEIWRGPALADVAYEDFAQREIGRLEELRLSALEERIEADLRLGRHGELVAELEAAVDAHPLRERLRAQLMLALYRSGRQADSLESFRNARETLIEELGLEPGIELRELEAAILRQDAALDVEPASLRARRHLPASTTPFLGRREELRNLTARFREGARLVTLTGPGGSGKTRLALQTAHDLAVHYDDGVYFVDLAAVADPGFLSESVATALELRDAPLHEYLAQRRLLLVLDNFEQIDAAAPVVADLLKRAPHVSALVTSRSALHLYGEHVFAVPPLIEEDALALFVARAREAGREVERSPALNELCAWLDRLPLAIELVAARARELPPEQVLDLLPPRLELATQGPRDAPARQRTLRATIEWSYELLADTERAVLARVSVFVGGFTPDAAQAVCGAELSELAGLVAASLVVEPETPAEAPRLALLETVREYALERINESGELALLREQHAGYFLDLARRAEPELEAAAEQWLRRLEVEHDNLRAALDWAAAHGKVEDELRIAVALRRFWLVRGHSAEAQRRLEAALGRAGDQPARLRAIAAGAAGQFALARADYERAKSWTNESLSIFRSLDDRAGIARSFTRLGDIAKAEDDLDDAARNYASALEVARDLADRHAFAAALTNAGALALTRDDLDEGDRLSREALSVWRELGHTEGIAIALLNVGVGAIDRRDYAEALPLLRETLELSGALGYRAQLAGALGNCAVVGARSSQAERAMGLVAAMDELLAAIGERQPLHGRRRREEVIAAAEAVLSERELATAMKAGQSLLLDEAIAYGLETVRLAARASSPES
jgi:predicted ATPase/DNA-binding SARP family transcriptional activator